VSENLRVSVDAGIATIVLDRPPANAMSTAVMHELSEACTFVSGEGSVRVAIVRSDVPGFFMAGADLKDMSQRMDRVALTNASFREFLDRWEKVPFPTIAQIEGHALGGGCELALACDFRVMAEGPIWIGLPEVKHGLLPAGGGTQRMLRLLGRARTLDLILRGRRIHAEEAAQLGLITKSCHPDSVQRCVSDLASEFLKLAPLTLAAIKRIIIESEDMSMLGGLSLEALEMSKLGFTDDVREGVAAFVEKRPADFKGR